MKTSEAFPSKYLKAADLGDRNWTMTIDDYQQEELMGNDGRKQLKTVLYFRRAKKPMVLNTTNMRVIEHAYGDEMDDWRGKEIVLFSREIEARGETVNAIRVRIPQPGQSTAPAHHQSRPAPAPGFTSGLPGHEAQPAQRRPAAEHPGQYDERNPPPNTGQNYRADMDDEIPF